MFRASSAIALASVIIALFAAPTLAQPAPKPEDLKAIYAFLRTVKPIQQSVEKWPSPAGQQKKTGDIHDQQGTRIFG